MIVMGQWDYKNYNVAVWSTVDMTDPKVKDFVRDWNITYEQYADFFMNTVRYHPYAEKIIRFFIEYKDGALLPDKWDGAEPIREIFDKDDYSRIVSLLAYPGMRIFFKKKRKHDIEIWNYAYKWSPSFIWKNKKTGWVLQVPHPKPCKYLTRVEFSFPEHLKPDMGFLKELMEDLCKYLETDYGIVYFQETKEVICSYKDTILLNYHEEIVQKKI